MRKFFKKRMWVAQDEDLISNIEMMWKINIKFYRG